MSSPLIWIALPGLFAVLLFFLRRRSLLVSVLAGVFCFLLAALAWVLPIASVVKIGSFNFEIASVFTVLGRRFILDDGHRTFLLLLYLVSGFWFFGVRAARTHSLFVPLGLGMLALLVAASAVEPFLYAALLVEIAVLLSIPMLSPPGRPLSQGVLRYLIFQTLAMPFILFAGWSLAAIEANPSNLSLYPQAEVFLGLGFAFWLAVFPFYTWIPLLAEHAHPYIAGFVLTLLSTVILLLTLNFLDAFAWLRTNTLLMQGLRLSGLVMVGTGGVWSAFQRNPARLLGYAVIIENGFSLLALSVGFPTGGQMFARMFLPRMAALALMALALSIWQAQPGFAGFDQLKGMLRRTPLLSTAFLLACFSFAGLPLLGGFPARQVLLEAVAGQSVSITFWVLAGNLGFLINTLRSLMLMAASDALPWQRRETPAEMFMLVVGILVLLAIGVFPGLILPRFLNLLMPFTHLR